MSLSLICAHLRHLRINFECPKVSRCPQDMGP